MPFAHMYGSRIYERDEEEQEMLGELFTPTKWRGCNEPCPCAAGGLTGSEEQWQQGTSIHDPLPACFPGSNVPLKCDALIMLVCGGVAYGDQPKSCHMEETFDCYSPFGAASPILVNEPCVFVQDLFSGRGEETTSTVSWTHYIDIDSGLTVLDGCTRTDSLNTQNYSDGDEIRIPSGGVARYVVVWVTFCSTDAGTVKRVYLMRHSA